MREPKKSPEFQTPKRKARPHPVISRRVLNTANYWMELEAEDEPESPDFTLGDHLRQLREYNSKMNGRRAAAPYLEMFATQQRACRV